MFEMSFTHFIDQKVNCSFFKHYGPFDLRAFDECVAVVLSHADYRIGMSFLHDLRDQHIPQDLDFKSLSEMSKHLIKDFSFEVGPCRGAMVAGDVQSYAKIHQFVLSGRYDNNLIERKAFRDIKKAMEWLGLPEDYEIKNPEPDETS